MIKENPFFMFIVNEMIVESVEEPVLGPGGHDLLEEVQWVPVVKPGAAAHLAVPGVAQVVGAALAPALPLVAALGVVTRPAGQVVVRQEEPVQVVPGRQLADAGVQQGQPRLGGGEKAMADIEHGFKDNLGLSQ